MKSILLCLSVAFIMYSNASAQNSKLTASQILNHSFDEARRYNKNVIVVFTSSWCINCHILEKKIFNDSLLSGIFSKNYIIAYLDVLEHTKKELETPGGTDFLKKYVGENVDPGLPVMLIFNRKGKLLADSFKDKSNRTYESNIGRPGTGDEITHFLKMLKATSSLSEKQLQQIASKCNPNLTITLPNQGEKTLVWY